VTAAGFLFDLLVRSSMLPATIWLAPAAARTRRILNPR
jgi:hypothetical protein